MFHAKMAMIVILPMMSLYAADEPADFWGSRPGLPAVVNPAVISALQQVVSLRGEWEFVTDPRWMGRHRMGKGPDWNEPDWTGARTIEVPGCWEAQGVGEPGMSLTWDLPFDRIPRPLNHIYMGAARYRRYVTIPEDWTGKRVWLKVGGVRTEAWLWVNQHRVAHLNTYCGTYKYDITEYVTPGAQAEIVATVRNDSPSRKGCQAAFHRFGGFYRDVELEATPDTRIDDVWVRGDFDRRAAVVNIETRHEGASPPADAELEIALRTLDGHDAGSVRKPLVFNETGIADIAIEMALQVFRPWSPESPNLYLAEVTLQVGGRPVHGWVERFGIRKFEVRGERFFLNNHPFFVRGYGDDYIYPLTLTSPPDRAVHLKNMHIARRAGFNYARLHTHCELPEYFEAADEAGLMVQPELPYYHDITTEAFPFDPMRDLRELYRHFRRYVSFASYSTGNEGHLGSPLDRELYQWAKTTDPDRLFQHQDGGFNSPENADYHTPNGYGLPSSIRPWMPGAFDDLDMPFIAHEYLNLGIKMDPRIAPRFTGAIPAPRTLNNYETSLAAAGLDRGWGDACQDAAHALQGYYLKQGLEQARLDPACDGYSFWTLVDVMVPQEGTYTGQGYLNAFWEEKTGGLTLEAFHQFNGPTALLAVREPESAIAVSGQGGTVTLWVSHFTPETWDEVNVTWSLEAADALLAEGTLQPNRLVPGDVKPLGSCTFTVPDLDAPVHARFKASIVNKGIENQWDFWFFPRRIAREGASIAVTEDIHASLSPRYPGLVVAGTDEAKQTGVVIGSWDHPELLAAVRRGLPGLMIGPAEGNPNIELGWWWLGNQVGTAFAHHPVFGDFPHNGTLSPLWFRLIHQGLPLPLDRGYGTFTWFAIGEGQKNYFAYVMQKQENGEGPLLITHGINLLRDTPEGAHLLDQMIHYLRNEHGHAAIY